MQKIRSKVADLLMWLIQPSLAPLLSDLLKRQNQVIARLKDLEDKK